MTKEDKIKFQEDLRKNANEVVKIREEEEKKRKEIEENLKNFHKAVEERACALRKQDEIKARNSEAVYERNSELIEKALKNNDVEAIQKFLKDLQ